MRSNMIISCDFEDSTLQLLQFFIDRLPVSIRDIGYVIEEFIIKIINSLQSKEIISMYYDKPDVIDNEIYNLVENELCYMTEAVVYEMFSICIDTTTPKGLNDTFCLLLDMQNVSGITSGYYLIENGEYISECDISEVISIIYADLLYGIFIELVDKLCTIIMLAIYNEVTFDDAIISENKLLVVFSVDKEVPSRFLTY